MRLWLTLLLCFQLFLAPLAWSYDQVNNSCSGTIPSIQLTQKEKEITNICVKAMNKQGLPAKMDTSFSLDQILPMVGGCFLGAKDAVVDEIKGLALLTKFFVKEIPSYAWEKIKELFSDEDNAVGAVDRLSQSNISLIDKAKLLAQKYYSEFKKFLSMVRGMIKEEYQSFFCYPKPVQTKILCRLISDVFLLVFSPGKLLKGAKWTAEVSNAARKLVVAIMESGELGTKFSKKVEKAAEVLKLGRTTEKTTKVVSKLDEGSAIISKEVGGETVHYLQSTVKGQKVLREMVLDEHTKFFSIQGQGKKVIDQLIVKGVGKNGSVILVDVNNLGKVNYFTKGLSAGDEYLKAVSDVIRKTAGNKNIKVFRTGGDEISLFAEGMSAEEVFKFSQQLSKNVVADKTVQKIFIEERQALALKIAQAKKANKVQEVKELTAVLDEANKFDGSVSIGSHMLKKGDDYASIQTLANEGLSKGKSTYKKAKGLPFEKYGAPATNVKLEMVDGKIVPPVFMPN